MKILITGTVGESLPPPYAGIPKHSLFLAKLWREAGHEVALSFIYHHEDEDDLGASGKYYFEYPKKPSKLQKLLFLSKYLSKNPVLYTRLLKRYLQIGGIFNREAVLYAAYGVFIEGIMEEFKPDIVLGQAALIKTFMAQEVARMRGIRSVVQVYAEVHDMTMTPNKIIKNDQGRLNKYWKSYFENTDLILSPSIYCAQGPLKYVVKEKVKIIYFGIDTQKYLDFTEDRESARRYFTLPSSTFYFVAVGALTLRKGHDHLIRAVSPLVKRGLDVGILLCGPGNPTELKNLASQEGLEDKVHFFTGLSEEELMRLYRSANCYCDASNTVRACLGMSLTEGMIMGLPTVAYDAGGMPEVVLDGQNGFLAETNDISKLSQCLERVYSSDSSEQLRMGEAGRKIALETVSIEGTARKHLEFFKLALSAK